MSNSNLVWDRGTLFGLQSNGPHRGHPDVDAAAAPLWRYDWKPAPGSPEALLYTDFLVAKDWLRRAMRDDDRT